MTKERKHRIENIIKIINNSNDIDEHIVFELEDILMEEEAAYDNTPYNLVNSNRAIESKDAIDAINSAIDLLNEYIDLKDEYLDNCYDYDFNDFNDEDDEDEYEDNYYDLIDIDLEWINTSNDVINELSSI